MLKVAEANKASELNPQMLLTTVATIEETTPSIKKIFKKPHYVLDIMVRYSTMNDKVGKFIAPIFAATLIAGAYWAAQLWTAKHPIHSEHDSGLEEHSADELIEHEPTPHVETLHKEPPHWTYDESQDGPTHWGDLSSSYLICSAGMTQSPIDIRDPLFSSQLHPLRFEYHRTVALLKNAGHAIVLEVGNDSNRFYDGMNWHILRRVYFRTPSEHRIDGVFSDLEIQLEHESEQGQMVMVSVRALEGFDSTGITAAFSMLPNQRGAQRSGVWVDLHRLLPKRYPYFGYAGSMTFPPCTEGVSWFILKNQIQVGRRVLDELVGAIPRNARPLQSLAARRIYASMK